MILLAKLGALIMISVGAIALLSPQKFSELTELKASSPLAKAEVRGAIGGMFVALGLFALLVAGRDSSILYGALAAGWLGVFIGKLVSMFKDKLTLNKAMPGLIIDGGLAILFFLGTI